MSDTTPPRFWYCGDCRDYHGEREECPWWRILEKHGEPSSRPVVQRSELESALRSAFNQQLSQQNFLAQQLQMAQQRGPWHGQLGLGGLLGIKWGGILE